MFATVKLALTAAIKKRESFNQMQFLYLDRCIGLRLILLRNENLQLYYYDDTIKTFRLSKAHLTAFKQR